MFKIFDVQCNECENVEEVMVQDSDEFPVCSECSGTVKRLYTTMNFKLIYDNKKDTCSWADHGYASSQYWNKIKEARSRGEDVKSPEE